MITSILVSLAVSLFTATLGLIAKGVSHMDILSAVVGFVGGSVVTVVVPAVYKWVKKQVTSVEAKAAPVVADVKAVANTVSKVV